MRLIVYFIQYLLFFLDEWDPYYGEELTLLLLLYPQCLISTHGPFLSLFNLFWFFILCLDLIVGSRAWIIHYFFAQFISIIDLVMAQSAYVIVGRVARCQVLLMINVLYPFFRYDYESTNIYLFFYISHIMLSIQFCLLTAIVLCISMPKKNMISLFVRPQ